MTEFISFSGRKRHLAGNTARKADFNEIPTISLAAPEQEIINQLRDACTRVGFFYIKDHDVPQDVIRTVFSTAKAFFDQSLEVKSEIHYKKNKVLHGYEPIAEVRTDESKRADLNEAFNCGYEAALDPLWEGDAAEAPEQDSPMQGENAWPRMSDFKHNVAAYYGSILTLARRIVKLLAKVLELPDDYFDSAILNVDGQWIQAPPVEGTFVVNIGDMLARWSNDVFISTVHRVHNSTGCERYSIPFFFGPSYDTVLQPLPTCIPDGGKADYDAIVAGDYVWQRLAQSRLTKEEAKTKTFTEHSVKA
ncbi:2-oxoglutarate-Fe(II) type oxidoreductase hxnY [Pseudocercospora fuligena]|uniref:2-oxoglutarate-Fe(II) type oxidoreductase hxnY n=1 Tax=Pseudocercospora fuligena TaxID=685502 RepID=A0A8H6RM83_9PEZI|nr:2-oxoglutarate-Fe(II) type oxidoreductase hxnY [Pseudocercospora fuligena]